MLTASTKDRGAPGGVQLGGGLGDAPSGEHRVQRVRGVRVAGRRSGAPTRSCGGSFTEGRTGFGRAEAARYRRGSRPAQRGWCRSALAEELRDVGPVFCSSVGVVVLL